MGDTKRCETILDTSGHHFGQGQCERAAGHTGKHLVDGDEYEEQEDCLDVTRPAADVDADLRAAGADPEAIRAEGAAFVAGLRAQREAPPAEGDPLAEATRAHRLEALKVAIAALIRRRSTMLSAKRQGKDMAAKIAATEYVIDELEMRECELHGPSGLEIANAKLEIIGKRIDAVAREIAAAEMGDTLEHPDTVALRALVEAMQAEHRRQPNGLTLKGLQALRAAEKVSPTTDPPDVVDARVDGMSVADRSPGAGAAGVGE